MEIGCSSHWSKAMVANEAVPSILTLAYWSVEFE